MSHSNATYWADHVYYCERDQYGWPVGLKNIDKEKISTCVKASLEQTNSPLTVIQIEEQVVGNTNTQFDQWPVYEVRYAAIRKALQELDCHPVFTIK